MGNMVATPMSQMVPAYQLYIGNFPYINKEYGVLHIRGYTQVL